MRSRAPSPGAPGAPRAAVRRPRREHYPDLAPKHVGPTLTLVPPGRRDEAIRVRGLVHTITPVEPEPGDETRQILALRAPDGTRCECVEWDDCHLCSCPQYQLAEGSCDHLRALVLQGVFRALPRDLDRHAYDTAEPARGRA